MGECVSPRPAAFRRCQKIRFSPSERSPIRFLLLSGSSHSCPRINPLFKDHISNRLTLYHKKYHKKVRRKGLSKLPFLPAFSCGEKACTSMRETAETMSR